ncbi:hypothetical protein PHET_10378 [Paragonimus heterotremus]|uniref:Tyrosine-protein kinase ephrin type A/B receptor-like domain-containing protein n=1 Tax=Paragonimus heterotremus TaxID=100268 RepID=A0A8J4WDX5_9TREM|nr:hypothetical protein PHET_10378 [Paragonimus heterotremus]
MILVSSTLIHIFLLWDSTAGQAISFVSPTNCSVGTTTVSAEYFNTATLLCEPCSQSTRFQKQSEDGLSCSCQPGYRIIKNVGGNTLTCEACNANETVTEDGLQCIPCAENSFDDSTETCKPCPSDSYSGLCYLAYNDLCSILLRIWCFIAFSDVLNLWTKCDCYKRGMSSLLRYHQNVACIILG